jgi:SH3-like domain-containing protein
MPAGPNARARYVASRAFVLLVALGVAGVAIPCPVGHAQERTQASGERQLPRFVSLKSARVNMRQGPGENYPIAWVYTREGLPVEVVQEFDNWRRIRDSDGTEGWVFQGLLSGRRTAVVAPWEKGEALPIRAAPEDTARITAYLEPGVLAAVTRCRNGWCRLTDSRFVGWIRQDRLWGVYPDETID